MQQGEEIRSYLVRRGRTGPTSRDALARLLPVHGVTAAEVWAAPPQVVEIGFGMGDATAELAVRDPRDTLAIDVHPAGIAALLRRIEALGLTNVRVHEGDCVPVLAGLPDGCLEEVRLYFPDPWPKTRHHKRRLVSASFAALVAARLRPGGAWRLATDWPDYARQIADVAGAEPALEGGLVERWSERPVTKFERKGIAAGRPITDLCYRRR